MIVLILLAFAGMLAGIFLLLGMTPFEFAEDLTKSFASREWWATSPIKSVSRFWAIR